MNHLHKQYLKTACYDKHSPFENLLEKNNSVTINQENGHFIVTSILDIVKGISQSMINELLH